MVRDVLDDIGSCDFLYDYVLDSWDGFNLCIEDDKVFSLFI